MSRPVSIRPPGHRQTTAAARRRRRRQRSCAAQLTSPTASVRRPSNCLARLLDVLFSASLTTGAVLSCRVARLPPDCPSRSVLSPLERRLVRRSGIRTGEGAAFGALNQRRAIELPYACTLVGVPWTVGGWMHWHAARHSSLDVPSSLGTIRGLQNVGQLAEVGVWRSTTNLACSLSPWSGRAVTLAQAACPQSRVAGSLMFTLESVR